MFDLASYGRFEAEAPGANVIRYFGDPRGQQPAKQRDAGGNAPARPDLGQRGVVTNRSS